RSSSAGRVCAPLPEAEARGGPARCKDFQRSAAGDAQRLGASQNTSSPTTGSSRERGNSRGVPSASCLTQDALSVLKIVTRREATCNHSQKVVRPAEVLCHPVLFFADSRHSLRYDRAEERGSTRGEPTG